MTGVQTCALPIYRDEKANSPEAQAAREKEAEQRFIASLEGAKYICPGWRNRFQGGRLEIDIRNGKIHGAMVTTWINPEEHPENIYVGFRGLWGDDIPLRGRVNVDRSNLREARVEIYDDRLVVEETIKFSNSSPDVMPLRTCLRTK